MKRGFGDPIGASYEMGRSGIQQSDAARIVGLFCRRLPSNIARFVMAVVINTADRVCWGRPWSHMGVEGFKTVGPFFANFNTSSSIEPKRGVVWPTAAFLDRRPNLIFRRFAQSVCAVCLACVFSISAPATNLPAGRQVANEHRASRAAVASTDVLMLPLGIFLQDDKTPEAFTDHDAVVGHLKILQQGGVS